MAQKTVKKPVTKPTTTKATVKKTAAKKTVKKAAVKQDEVIMAVSGPLHDCKCGAECNCGATCGCKGGCKFGRFMGKLILALIIFALGFAAAKICCTHGGDCNRMSRPTFQNGCMDVSTVKCPKLQAALPTMDANDDGCITRAEYRAARKMMRQDAPVVVTEQAVEVVE